MHTENGNALVCSSKSCKKKIFPSLNPTIIVNITCQNHILLARNIGWKNLLYSCLAGFCEQNESAEEAVQREIYEEVGLELIKINYKFSQYWPFSSNLMLGFQAEVLPNKKKLNINKNELHTAKWFTSDEIISLVNKKKLILPRKESIAYALIYQWMKKKIM